MDKLSATIKAIKITEDCLKYISSELKKELSEIAISKKISDFFIKKGASSLAFETLVCSGKRTSLFHGPTSNKRIKSGEPIYIDLGCKYKGYCSDMTRMFFIGKPNKGFLEIYNLVKKAQSLQEKALKPGKTYKEIDLIARELFKGKGLDNYFVHSTGHGIGRTVHQNPIISYKRNGCFKKGMVVTIEPGLYLPKKYGVRIEDMYLITDTGAKRLTFSSRNIKIL